MFLHRPILQTEVNVQNPDPKFAEQLLEQSGGGAGELTAALTYWTQSFHTVDAAIRDMLQDIGTEEFTYLEIIAMLIEQHTRNAGQKAASQHPPRARPGGRGSDPIARCRHGGCGLGRSGVGLRDPTRQDRAPGKRALDPPLRMARRRLG
jgi:hypothetical protein